MKGKFITLEGPEGSGKTTVSNRIVKMLEEKGLIERKSSGKGNPNHIYVKIKPYKENVSKDLNKFNTGTKENDKYDIKKSKETTLSNPNTNKYINKNNIENNYKYRQGDRL